MRVTMFFHGGYSYAMFNTNRKRDAEEFPSLRAAVETFRKRTSGLDSRYPCTDESATAWVMLCDARVAIGAEYPDRTITIGKRGGLVVADA